MSRRNVIALIMTISSACTMAREAPARTSQRDYQPSASLPIDRLVKAGKLPNGLTYYIKPDRRFDTTHVELVVDAGNGEEAKDQIGLAHLLEHLAFSWSDGYPNAKWRDFRTKYGIEPSSGYNASTGRVTRYWVKVPGSGDAVLSETFGIVRNWLDGMVITQDRMDRERPVVLSEVQSNDNAYDFSVNREMLYRLLDSPAYDVKFRKIHDENVETAKLASLQRFYNDWYRPDLAAVIVVGPVDVTKAEELLRAEFGQVKPKRSSPAKSDTDLPLKVELTGRSKYLTKFDRRLIGIRYVTYRKRPSRSDGLRLVADLRYKLIDQLVERLAQKRIEDSVSSGELGCTVFLKIGPLWSSLTRIDALESNVACRDAKGSEEALKSLQLSLAQMMTYGFSESEIRFVKAAMNQEEKTSPASQSAEVEVLADNYLYGRPITDLDHLADVKQGEIESIKPKEILTRLRYFQDTSKNFDFVATGNQDFESEALSKPRLDAIMAKRLGKAIPPFIVLEAPASLMKPSQRNQLPPHPIVSDMTINELGARKVQLANGVGIYFIGNDGPASGQVSITGFRRAGCGANVPNACANVSPLVATAGLSDLTSKQVSLFKKSRNIRSSVSVESWRTTVRVETPSVNWEDALQFIFLLMTDLRPDELAYRRLKKERYNERMQLGFVAQVDRKLQMESSQSGFDEDFGSVRDLDVDDYKQAAAAFDELWRDKGDLTFVVSGPLDLAEALPLTAHYLGALPSSGSAIPPNPVVTNEHHQFFATRPSKQWIELPPSIAATMTQKGYARIYSAGNYADSVVNRIELEMLRSILQESLFAELRENGGGVYTPSIWIDILRPPPGTDIGSYRIAIGFSSEPEQLNRLIEVVRTVLTNLAKNGLPNALVEKAIAQARSEESTINDVDRWSRQLVESLSRGEDPTELLTRESLLKSVISKETLDSAAKRYIRTDNLSITVISPSQNMSSGTRIGGADR